MATKFEDFLNRFDEKTWLSAATTLLPDIHEVDRAATEIWFRFYPLELFRMLQTAENRDELVQKFVMQGDYELKNQIDRSHRFLYGHRFWKDVKEAIVARGASFTGENGGDLAGEIKQIAAAVAAKTKTDASLLVGITAVGLMTLVQVGLDALEKAEGKTYIDAAYARLSPEKVLAERAKDDSQGLFGFLKTVDKEWTVTWDENQSGAKFKLIHDEEIASGAARDQSRDWKAQDERCQEGVIPVECRSAACGTCWVGVLGGAEKLSDVTAREAKRMKVFGYRQPEEPKPVLRLACQARAAGAVSIVIPPWNGVFGRDVYKDVPEEVLEPATTRAKENRKIVRETTKNQLL